MKLLMLLSLLFFANHILAKKPKVFCHYNHQGITKVYGPAYFDKKGNVVNVETIEEYAKVLGRSTFF